MKAIKDQLDNQRGDLTHIWIARDKDVVLQLLDDLGQNYVVISKAGSGLFGNMLELFLNVFRCLYLTCRYDVDLWFTKYGAGNIAAWILRKRNLSFNDDDDDIVPLISLTSYPFANSLLFPDCIRTRQRPGKNITYHGSHELVYLHPSRFHRNECQPSMRSDTPYCLLRLSALKAHHDLGKVGIQDDMLKAILSVLEAAGVRPVICSEKPLAGDFENYRASFGVAEIHQVLAGASLYIGDSQSMALEAAVLGVPVIRYSDFTTLSMINSFEQKGLIKSFGSGHETQLLSYLEQLVGQGNRIQEHASHWEKAISSFTDPLPVFVEAVESQLEFCEARQ